AGYRSLAQFILEDLARLLLHGSAILRSAHSELALGGFGQLTDGDTGHAINDITAINDCTAKITQLLTRHTIDNCLIGRVPVLLLPRPISFRRHHAGH